MHKTLGCIAVLTNSANAQQPPCRANDFSDFVGISGVPLKMKIIQDSPMKGAGTTFAPEVFHDLGIRNHRTLLKYDLTLPCLIRPG